MPSTYSNLKFELIAPGEQAGTWGATTNTNIGTALEEAITGSADVTFASADVTLTLTDTNASQPARNLRLNLVGVSGGARNLILGAGCQIDKQYIVRNNLADAVTIRNTTGSGVVVAPDSVTIVFNDGVNVTAAIPEGSSGGVSGPLTSVNNGIALFDGTSGQVLKSSAAQDGFVNGVRVGRGNNSGANCVALGGLALNSLTTADSNTAIGHEALRSITTGSGNIAVGSNAMSLGAGLNTSVGIGVVALNNATTGIESVAIGYGAMSNATATQFNTAVGASALGQLVGGSGTSGNVALGAYAMSQVTTGPFKDNVAIGVNALSSVSSPPVSGEANVCIGVRAGARLSTGDDNVVIGADALSFGSSAAGTNNILIGAGAGDTSSPFVMPSPGPTDHRIVLGNNSITNAYIRVAWTVTSDARDKTDFAPLNYGLDVIDSIETYTFRFDNRSAYFVYDEDGNVIATPPPDGTHKTARLFTGFSAQQVKSVLDAAGYPENIIVDAEDPENLKMKETAFIPLLINAIKELKAELSVVKAELAALAP